MSDCTIDQMSDLDRGFRTEVATYQTETRKINLEEDTTYGSITGKVCTRGHLWACMLSTFCVSAFRVSVSVFHFHRFCEVHLPAFISYFFHIFSRAQEEREYSQEVYKVSITGSQFTRGRLPSQHPQGKSLKVNWKSCERVTGKKHKPDTRTEDELLNQMSASR